MSEPNALFGLAGDDAAAFRAMFVAFAAELGLPGERLHAELVEGGDLKQSFGLGSVELDAIYAVAHRRLAVGRADKAGTLFGALALLAPEREEYWLGLALSRRGLDDASGALSALDLAGRLRPSWAPVHFHRLEILLERQDWAAAAEALNAFDAADPSGVTPYMRTRTARLGEALARKVREAKLD